MCGIGGVMNCDGKQVALSVLNTMANSMAHRGPDGSGYHLAGAVGLVQTRLAIVDLLTGNQPFHEAGGNITLVANGEIYNAHELRSSLKEVCFVSHSDCEPLLYLYRRHGLLFTNHLRGMYAIALHDPGEREQERLILARDPFGIKPLYYTETAEGFLFASEVKTLLATGAVQALLNHKQTVELLQLQFTTGTNCLLAGIQRVAPGETIVIESGRILERYRRHALLHLPRETPLLRDPIMALETALREAVYLHQQADLPYGMFLSGGVDSSALLAMMARLNERPVLAFTAWFPDSTIHDERFCAKAVATAVGATHIEVPFTETDFWALLPAVVAALDDPTADYAAIPTYKLAYEASKVVKVILSGEGGDELFAGYSRYRGIMRPWPFTKAIRRNGNLDGLGLWRQKPTGWRDGIAVAEQVVSTYGSNLQQSQKVDCTDWLPNDLLIKLDRCLMAHSIEGRVPFLDPMLAQFAYTLPDNLKIRHGIGKWLLRCWLANVLPVAQPFAPKRGFTVPVGSWIARRGRTIGPLVARTPVVAELCYSERVEALFADANRNRRTALAAWVLLFLALWTRCHIDAVHVNLDEDIFALLVV